MIELLAGAVGGLIALAVEHTYLAIRDRQTRNKKLIISFPNNDRRITESIFTELSPGASIELMRSVLGTPNKTFQDLGRLSLTSGYNEDGAYHDVPEPEVPQGEEEPYTNSYLYVFKNAWVKVTSKDKETVDSLTVLTKDNSLSMDSLLLPEGIEEDARFGVTKVTKEWIMGCNYEFLLTRRDRSFAISHFFGSPLYRHYTFFGSPLFNEEREEKESSGNECSAEYFIGGIIEGVCISSEASNIYYIYDYELL